ncbi:hypothetical protein V2J09_004105 [Rumex salicifolius]
MVNKRRRRKLQFSKIYTFGCGKAPLTLEDHSQIGGPGFSRVVYCNEADGYESSIRNYLDNYVRTTKYTLLTFVPKSLFEQFRRVANFYFLVVGILAFTPLAPYTAVSAIVPLIFVIGVSMLKEAVEDWRRLQQDIEVNTRKLKVHNGNGGFIQMEWRDVRVGDIVKVEKDDFFAADLLLLSSSYEDAVCYVETMNLDGETNLKLKQALEGTASMIEDSSFQDFRAIIRCEDRNASLYTFVGTMEFKGNQFPLSPQQILLRGSKLRNTDHIYGAVVFTGHDTKVMQNLVDPPSKRSRVEKKMDQIIYVLFGLLGFIALTGSFYFGVKTKDDLKNGMMKRWYLRPDDSTMYFDPKGAPLAAFFHFLTALMLYSYLIPISLYVSIEIVKVLQSLFINQDVNMYYEEADKPAHARTSNLNEELGQVDTILSDKTGTLTCNSMEFNKCSVAGTPYGHSITEDEKSMARRSGVLISGVSDDAIHKSSEEVVRKSLLVRGFNFKDKRIMNGQWANETHADVIEKFLQLLAVCHTVIPEVDEETGKISYEAESPDEAAFVIAARELGFEFYKRTQTSVSIHEFDPRLGKQVDRTYRILNVLEFNSTRKRMSVIVETEEGKLLLLSKGADSVMFTMLAKGGAEFEEQTKEHIHEYADAGLRTLVLAYREISNKEYREFNFKFSAARNSITADRDAMIDQVTETIEKDLILLGATAVEDKLQPGVPECIDKLAQAGIKIWVLTGDKMETAINIGLLRQGMKQIIITLDAPEIKDLEKERKKQAIIKASNESVLQQIHLGKHQLATSASASETFALIIDGKALAYALEDDAKKAFLELAMSCASVICCRSSPKQKALVTRLVKNGTGRTTLAIGDGANDVGMLQEADIGIGISGAEGMQAVMSSDVAIAQFRYLERLLLVHGHWCYRRISSMICYFFYKNITFGMTVFLYEAYTSFSAKPAYNDWFLSLYNVLFSSLPPIALGVFDQDVWLRILSWMFNGIYSGAMIFFFTKRALEIPAFNDSGKTADFEIFGATMYTCVVWVVNTQMALFVNYFTLIQHIVLWGGIVFWYLFLLAYGAMSPSISTTAYQVYVEALALSPKYWLAVFFVVVSALVPYCCYIAIQMWFFPVYHNVIQWIRLQGLTDDSEFCSMVKQRSIRDTTVGCTARRMRLET